MPKSFNIVHRPFRIPATVTLLDAATDWLLVGRSGLLCLVVFSRFVLFIQFLLSVSGLMPSEIWIPTAVP